MVSSHTSTFLNRSSLFNDCCIFHFGSHTEKPVVSKPTKSASKRMLGIDDMLKDYNFDSKALSASIQIKVSILPWFLSAYLFLLRWSYLVHS